MVKDEQCIKAEQIIDLWWKVLYEFYDEALKIGYNEDIKEILTASNEHDINRTLKMVKEVKNEFGE